MPTNTDIVRGLYEAYARGDMDQAFRRFATDVEVIDPVGMTELGFSRTHKGHDELREHLGQLAQRAGELRTEVREFVAERDKVVVLGTHHLRTPTGRVGEVGFVHLFTLADEKITRLEECTDTAVFRRLLEA